MSESKSQQERIADLERRVAVLESALSCNARGGSASAGRTVAADQVAIVVSNKRYQPTDTANAVYQDHMWFDCEFRAAQLRQPARAIKGLIEFCDLFGEARFRLGYTLSERLQPGGSAHVLGLGFEYNQFMAEHQWMRSTDLADMTVRFDIAQILYVDGTREAVP